MREVALVCSLLIVKPISPHISQSAVHHLASRWRHTNNLEVKQALYSLLPTRNFAMVYLFQLQRVSLLRVGRISTTLSGPVETLADVLFTVRC